MRPEASGRAVRRTRRGRAAGLPRGVLRVAGRRDPREDAATGRDRRCRHRPRPAPGRVVHAVAGGRFDDPHPARRSPGRVRRRPLPLRRAPVVPSIRHGAVRAADGGRRDGVPRVAAAGGSTRVPALAARRGADARRARVLQRRGRRPNGRGLLVEPRSAARGSGPDARRVETAGVHDRHPAPPAPGDHRGRVDRVPLHVHLVRRRAAAVRPRPRHPGGRDLPPGDRALRPAHRRRARARADRGGPGGGVRARAVAGAARGRPTARRRGRRGATAARAASGSWSAGCSGPRRCSSAVHSPCWCCDRCGSAAAGVSVRTARSVRARRRRPCSSRRGSRFATRWSSPRSRRSSRSSSVVLRRWRSRPGPGGRPGRSTRS